MELSTILAIAAGILVEILLLWETADRQKGVQSAPGILAPRLSRMQEIIGLVVIVSWLLILLAEVWNPTLSFGTRDLILGAVAVPTGLFLFTFGMLHTRLLPRINEQTIVVINLLILCSLSITRELEWYWLAALLIPSLGVLIMALTPRTISPVLKSLLYFWYLSCLFIMTYQNSLELYVTSERDFTSLDYFITSAAGIFLYLHSIFLIRFFLMLTANILPQNRYLIGLAMPQLFDDQQIPRLKFLGILAIFATLVVLNRFTSVVPSLSLLNVLTLMTVHFMDRPFQLTERL